MYICICKKTALNAVHVECIYVYMYICVYLYMYIYEDRSQCIARGMYICIYVYMYMYICIYIKTALNAVHVECIHVYMYILCISIYL